MKNGMLKRDNFIDFLRGSVMLLVLLHHAGIGGGIGKVILGFHMPLFFCISGFLMYKGGTVQKYNIVVFSKKRFSSLLIPYIYFEFMNLILSEAISVVSNNHINLLEAVKSILFCINTESYPGISLRLWFLPCIFVCNLLMYGILTYYKGRCPLWNLGAFLLGSWIFSDYIKVRMPFTIDIALMGTFFMLLGYKYGKYIELFWSEKRKYMNLSVAVGAALILVICVWFNKSPFYMYQHQYGNYLFSVSGAIAGCLFWILIVKEIYSKLNNKACLLHKILVWYGKNSLCVFPVHIDVLYILRYVLRYLKLAYWEVYFILMTVISIGIVELINKYVPFVLGKNKDRRKK